MEEGVPPDLSGLHDEISRLRTHVAYRAIYLPSTSSTQDVARQLAEHGEREGTLVLAERMYAGRGRFNRSWVAPPGGIWLTLLLQPPLEIAHLTGLAAALSVTKALGRLWGIEAWIKWPNDVVVGERKVCGVLGEAFSAGEAHYLLLGVGINVNNDLPPELSTAAVTLRELLGHPVPRLPLLTAFLTCFDERYAALTRGDRAPVIRELRSKTSTLNRRVRALLPSGSTLEGTAKDIADDGSLVLESASGRLVVIRASEIVHVR